MHPLLAPKRGRTSACRACGPAGAAQRRLLGTRATPTATAGDGGSHPARTSSFSVRCGCPYCRRYAVFHYSSMSHMGRRCAVRATQCGAAAGGGRGAGARGGDKTAGNGDERTASGPYRRGPGGARPRDIWVPLCPGVVSAIQGDLVQTGAWPPDAAPRRPSEGVGELRASAGRLRVCVWGRLRFARGRVSIYLSSICCCCC